MSKQEKKTGEITEEKLDKVSGGHVTAASSVEKLATATMVAQPVLVQPILKEPRVLPKP